MTMQYDPRARFLNLGMHSLVPNMNKCRLIPKENIVFEIKHHTFLELNILLVLFQGAFWALMVGLVVGIVRFAWEFAYPRVACGEEDPKPDIISKVHYLHFGIILFAITFIVAVVVSLFTKAIPDKYVSLFINL